jgi:hypothetical protein
VVDVLMSVQRTSIGSVSLFLERICRDVSQYLNDYYPARVNWPLWSCC